MDVRYVADHAKGAVTEFPCSLGKYYGIDYGERALYGVPAEELPRNFVPDGSYPANDLSWYANIPVPTSYMIVNSRGDFFGGYDHVAHAGVVHVANHHVAPGKKQWTWGNHEFGYAWDRSLTDNDGPYIELMAGVYTDNQPDFSYLAPGETKTFSQFWYPIREIGVPDAANVHAALRVVQDGGNLKVHLVVTHAIHMARLRLSSPGNKPAVWSGTLRPETSEVIDLPCADGVDNWVLELESDGEILLRYAPSEIQPAAPPVEATEPPEPRDVATNDELYLTGLHLEQYRHATRSPEPYWREGLRRDPLDSRINNALGRFHLRRGEFDKAENCLRTAISRLTARNSNPYDSEPYYNLGMTLLFQEHVEEAYDSFYKATWSAAWRGPAYHRLAEIDARSGRFAAAFDHISRSLRAEAENLNAKNLRIAILRRLGRDAEAELELDAALRLDPLDIWSRYQKTGVIPTDFGRRLDLAFDCIRAGLFEEVDAVLRSATQAMELYTRAFVLDLSGKVESSRVCLAQAVKASATYVFPNRLEEMKVLQAAIEANPLDARAPYYLGNLLYDRKRHRDAIAQWETAAERDPHFPTVWRNLGIAFFNVEHEPAKARRAFEVARKADPNDARILYEEDQLRKRLGDDPDDRLAVLEAHRELVARRDDLSVELAAIYNHVGRPAEALELLLSRKFQPWEGGEGLVLGEYVRAQLLLGRTALAESNPSGAIERFEAADRPPQSLSEARHLLANSSNIEFWLGEAWASKGKPERAKQHWERAVRQRGDFQQMQVRSISEMTYWSAMAMRRLGCEENALSFFTDILNYAAELEQSVPKIDYFATSLPTMLLFDEDLQKRRHITATFLRGQALLGLRRNSEAHTVLTEVQRLDRAHADAHDLLTSSLTQQVDE